MTPDTRFSIFNALKDSDTFGEAWLRFQKRYEALILTWCRRQGLQHADAEDVTQQILLRLFQYLPSYDHDPDRGRFRTFLQRVVINAVVDHLRVRRPFHIGAGGGSQQELLNNLAGPASVEELTVPFEQQLGDELRQAIDQVRREEGEAAWQAFFLTLEEKRPVKEVAEQLKMPVATVYQKRFQVRAMLRKILGDSKGFCPSSVEPTGR